MIIGPNGEQYQIVPEDESIKKFKMDFHDIGTRVKEIIRNREGLSAIDNISVKYPYLPPFVIVFYKAVYCKGLDSQKAAELIDDAKNEFENIDSRQEDYDKFFLDYFLWRTRITFWGQAGEIYANANRDRDSVEAYHKYISYKIIDRDNHSRISLLTFRKVCEYTLEDIQENKITLSSPSKMNDPFDMPIIQWLKYHSDKSKGRKHIKNLYDAANDFCMRSFSRPISTDNNEMIKSIKMWSHYADKHKGICIEYSFSKDFRCCTESELSFMSDVKYIHKGNKLDITKSEMNSLVGICAKSDEWSEENETRYIVFRPFEQGPHIYKKLDNDSYISKIYFGLNCSKKNIHKVLSTLKNRANIKFYKMELNPEDLYDLTYDEFNPN